jgi:hypothetical protein
MVVGGVENGERTMTAKRIIVALALLLSATSATLAQNYSGAQYNNQQDPGIESQR